MRLGWDNVNMGGLKGFSRWGMRWMCEVRWGRSWSEIVAVK